MKKITLIVSLFILLCNLQANASRTMYVDNFDAILGDTVAENTLLNYAMTNGIDTILLYDLHIVNANYNLPNAVTNYILADFIFKAKTSYNITSVGATAENDTFFTNVIDAYNNTRSNALEKFDIYNLEFEYWISSTTNPGGYYCNSYLTPNGIPCDRDGAFQFFISTLQTMATLAANNPHSIKTEAYVGWPTTIEASTIGANLDNVRLHAYVSDPNTAFGYSEDRIKDFANGNPNLEVSIIFSSEPAFMQNWLINNSMITAENIFIQDWQNAALTWTNNINLQEFTYFTYSHNINNITLSTNSEIVDKLVKIFPNPVKNVLSVLNISTVKNIKIYNNIGQLVIETKEENINVKHLNTGIYFCQFETKKGIETIKIIKE